LETGRILIWLGSIGTILFAAIIIRTWSMPTDIAAISTSMTEIQRQMDGFNDRLLYVERNGFRREFLND